MPNPDVSIQLRQVSIHTHHGVGAAEREVGQRMVFDIDLVPEEPAATVTDELAGTLDYGAVTELLVDTATGTSYLTLERLAMVIAERMLVEFEASSVRVRALKVEPPIPVTMESAGVDLTLRRESAPS